MKSFGSRLMAAAIVALLAWVTLSAATSNGPVLQPDKLVILGTTDVRGKTAPCG